MKTEFQKNKEWVDTEREALTNLYLNKYIVVHAQKVISSFDDFGKAVDFSIENYGLNGGFYIELMTAEEPVNVIMQALL